MIDKKYAVIDLGSNTFHLLIANVTKDNNGIFSFQTVYRKQVFVGLSDGGDTHIKEVRMELGLDTLRQFKEKLDLHQPSKIKIVGTAVLRKATNRQLFIDSAELILAQKIAIIDGDQEAKYIYDGVRQIEVLNHGHQLVMDVGGGSTEFIVMQDGKNIWQKSYRLGGGVLHHLFHKNEPITLDEINTISNHIADEVSDLRTFMYNRDTIDYLAGASGSFEILAILAGIQVQENQCYEISLMTFVSLYNKVIKLNLQERDQLDRIPKERAKLIIVGLILKKTILELFQPQNILVSPYSMKEGVLYEMAQYEN